MSDYDTPDSTACRERISIETGSDGQLVRLVVEYRPSGDQRRRVRYEPRGDGPGWWRTDDEWTGCVWRPVGREVVEDIRVEVSSGG